jgi:CHAT domain-containing protein
LGVTKEGTTKSGRTYPALTYASLELDDVKTTLGGKSQIAKDEKFTKTALQTMGPYQVVHIASHFEFTPGSIDDSVLLLGDNTTMSLSEIERGLNFTNVELLTLSACQTALGDKGGGDGSEFDGLGNIAQEKGAKAVIATLWPVADASTAAFMEALYKAHQAGNDKAESLRQAQLTLLHASAQDAASSGEQQRGLGRSAAALAPSSGGSSRNPNAPFAHPYYWAPFILMGNWL